MVPSAEKKKSKFLGTLKLIGLHLIGLFFALGGQYGTPKDIQECYDRFFKK